MIKYRVYDEEQKRYLNISNVSISGSGILRVVTYEDGRAKNSAVEFNKGCFSTGEHDGSSTRKRPMLLQNGCEIIGNVHENAELLEEK